MAFVIAAVALVGLVFACRGLLETNLGLTQIQGLPSDAEPRRAQDAAAQGFAPGILSPTVVLLEGVDDQLDLPGLVRLQRSLDDEPGVAASIGPATPAAREIPGLVLAGEADAARFLLVLDHDPVGGPAIDSVEALRDRLPALVEEAGLEDAQVGWPETPRSLRRPSRRSSATSSGSGSPRSSSTSCCWRSSCGRSWRRCTSCSRPAWRSRRASA